MSDVQTQQIAFPWIMNTAGTSPAAEFLDALFCTIQQITYFGPDGVTPINTGTPAVLDDNGNVVTAAVPGDQSGICVINVTASPQMLALLQGLSTAQAVADPAAPTITLPSRVTAFADASATPTGQTALNTASAAISQSVNALKPTVSLSAQAAAQPGSG